MEKLRRIFSGGIRLKIFRMLLITIVLIIAAYTAVFLYQSSRVEQLVDSTYQEQQRLYQVYGLEDQYESFRSSAVARFQREMFHARNILMISVVAIVATGLASAFSTATRITDPLNTITRRVASLGVRNRQFKMEDVYRTGDEIEVLAESFAKQSARTALYIEQIQRVTAEKSASARSWTWPAGSRAASCPTSSRPSRTGKSSASMPAWTRPKRWAATSTISS